jgi:hypothetical protein
MSRGDATPDAAWKGERGPGHLAPRVFGRNGTRAVPYGTYVTMMDLWAVTSIHRLIPSTRVVGCRPEWRPAQRSRGKTGGIPRCIQTSAAERHRGHSRRRLRCMSRPMDEPATERPAYRVPSTVVNTKS